MDCCKHIDYINGNFGELMADIPNILGIGFGPDIIPLQDYVRARSTYTDISFACSSIFQIATIVFRLHSAGISLLPCKPYCFGVKENLEGLQPEIVLTDVSACARPNKNTHKPPTMQYAAYTR